MRDPDLDWDAQPSAFDVWLPRVVLITVFVSLPISLYLQYAEWRDSPAGLSCEVSR